MVRGKDACWEHCLLVDATRQKVRCNYCQREFSGGVYRMKFHLAQIKNKDIVPCTDVPDEVRNAIRRILSTPKKQKASKKQKIAEEINDLQNSSSSSDGDHLAAESSGQHDTSLPSLLPVHPLPSAHVQPAKDDDAQQQKYEEADRKVALFFFHNSIHFSASKSIYYQPMVNAIADCGSGYKAPTYAKLRSTLLDSVKEEIIRNYKTLKDEWRETGCTILSEYWADGSSKSYLVFSVASPRGTHFLKSVDISSRADDAYYLFELFDSVIVEVGAENVVQIVTDSAASYVCARGLLLKKYPTVFLSQCASDCINSMLDDISKQESLKRVFENVRSIIRYVYGKPSVFNITKKFTYGRELTRPNLTRTATNYLSLRTIMILRNDLKHFFLHPDGLPSAHSRRPDGQAIESLIFSEEFWESAHEAVSVLEPLIKVLRIVEGDMPAMGYIYEGIEKAKISIKIYYKGHEEKYLPIWEIIDRRWNMQHSHLHAAAAFLNPSIFYNPCFKFDSNMRNGFFAAMQKLFPQEKDRIDLTKEQPMYVNAQGALGNEFAILGRTLNAPGAWWAAYGFDVPTLQRAAIRVLSQTCSLHWCKWNWGIFDRLHSKKHNSYQQQKFNDLVFVHCNLRLQAITQKTDGKYCNPIIYDEIDINSEWPTESDCTSALLDESWLDDFPSEC